MKISSILRIALLSTTASGLQSTGHAQGNLLNLYNGTNETMYVPPGTQNEFIQIGSPTSAVFQGGFTTNALGFYPGIPETVSPMLAVSLNTTTGTAYEITFTMQLGAYSGGADMSFGDFTTNCDLTAFYNPASPSHPYPPVNFDFTSIATSTITAISFEYYLDPEGGNGSLYNLEVMEVPEASTFRFVGFAGGVLLAWRVFKSWPERGSVTRSRFALQGVCKFAIPTGLNHPLSRRSQAKAEAQGYPVGGTTLGPSFRPSVVP